MVFWKTVLGRSFCHGAAARGAGFKTVASNREELQIWFLTTRYFTIGMAHMVGADRFFAAKFAGSAHIDNLNR